jgi:predicted ArsR family transcriptional regulator
MNEPRTIELHRALADGRRASIVGELRGAAGGLDVHELARRVGLHANTVRWHLGVLADAGLVSQRRAERSTPGRPRTIYALNAAAVSEGRDEFRLLASVLTGALAQDRDAVAKSEVAGWTWGRYLAPRRAPLSPPAREEATAEVVRLLDEQGFAPEAEGEEVRLRRCPYYDLAEQHPEVVCSVHKGLIAGALDELGSDLDVELTPFVRPDLCIARLVQRA